MKIDMSKIDKNMLPDEVVQHEGEKTYSVREAPFKLYGLCKSESSGFFKRMPQTTAEQLSEGYVIMNGMTAGIRARFKTDAVHIKLTAKTPSVTPITTCGCINAMKGFDLYIKDENGKEQYHASFRPPVEFTDGYDAAMDLPEGMKDITLYFPMYNQISDVFITIGKDDVILEGSPYTYEKPVLFFGSSITQGCNATRTGNTYESIISQMLDIDIINLGFSGSAKGQIPIAEYIASLPLAAFVYDYDHNAPDAEFLKNTHEPFFKVIRKAQPDLPILMLTKPDKLDPNKKERRDIIYKTYENAAAAGDKNVYFMDGGEFFQGEFAGVCTADSTHPNDYGFLIMAQKIAEWIKTIL